MAIDDPIPQPGEHAVLRPRGEFSAGKANDIQHGGTHYKKIAIEPWDYIAANNIGFFEGNAIKYLTRWRAKGGIEDLKKAKHYIDKLIELESQKAKCELTFTAKS